MKLKSILIIGNYPPPFGGVPRHIEYLAPYLVKKGWVVHILSGGHNGIEYKKGFTVYKCTRAAKFLAFMRSLPKLGKVSKLKLIRRNFFEDWLRYITLISLGREIIEKNSISIISAYNLYGAAPIGAILSEEYSIPLVVTNFGEIYSMINFFNKNVELVKYVCGVSKKLLAMSCHCANSYKLLGLSPKVEVIPYGVDINKFSPDNDGNKIRDKLGINHDDKLVLFVGFIRKEMGLHILIEAIPKVLQKQINIRSIIVGRTGNLLASAIKLSKKYRGQVFVIPEVPFEELPFYYAASTIVVAPTQGDRACGSLASIEAMATGKPVIASKVGGIPEIVTDKETGLLVPPEDADALSSAIINLLQDETTIKKMGILCREKVEKYFDEDKTDEKIERVFSELIEA